MIKFHIFTLFPELFPGPLGCSVVGKGLEKGLWQLNVINIRDFATDKHHTVDDAGFGGGAGMVMRADVLDAALSYHLKHLKDNAIDFRCIYFSPRGRVITQSLVRSHSHDQNIALLCGRFEGVDQRLLDHWQFEETSLGDFILTGGEIAAYAYIDSIVRLIPNIVGNQESIIEESFTNNLLEYPHYTRPNKWKDCKVPQVLLSGNHQLIKAWRLSQSESITQQRRPDLWRTYLKGHNENKE